MLQSKLLSENAFLSCVICVEGVRKKNGRANTNQTRNNQRHETFPVLGATAFSLFLFQNRFLRQPKWFHRPTRRVSGGALCHTGP
jgi:hypothetical protein